MQVQRWKSIWTWFVVAVVGNTTGFLNLDELKSFYYAIDIVDTPMLLQDEPSADAVILSSKYGQLYQCEHPLTDEVQRQVDAKPNDSSVIALLGPLETRPCLLYTKGWWTYEFCYHREIKQYHSEEGKIVGDTIFLGHYESEFDFSNNSSKTSRKRRSVQGYHSQFYVNGSHCELTGKARTTEARFVCQEGHGDYVAGVDERETCSYVVTVHTHRICSHPQFGPPVKMKTVSISCSPLLSATDYEIYLQEMSSVTSGKSSESLASNQPASDTTDDDLKKLFVDSIMSSIQAVLTGQQDDDDTEDDSKRKLTEAAMASGDTEETATTAASDSADAVPAGDGSRIEQDTNRATTADDVQAVATGDADEDDSEYIEQFDEELDNIASTANRRSRLARFKETIKSSMQSQFSDIVDEARADLARQGDDAGSVDNEDAFRNLAQTLNKLLERLDKMETESAAELHSEQPVSSATSTDSNSAEAASAETVTAAASPTDDVTADAQTREAVQQEAQEKDDDQTRHNEDTSTDDTGDGELLGNPVRPDQGAGSGQNADSGDNAVTDTGSRKHQDQKQPTETQLRERLEQAGLKMAGRKVEFRILTTGYVSKDGSDSLLADDDSETAFGKVIIAIIGDDDAESQEQEHHQRLEDNYRFQLHSKNKDRQLQSESDPEAVNV